MSGVDMSSAMLDEARAILGEPGVLTAADDIAPFLVEERKLHRGHASAVLRPRNTAEVSALVGLAHRHRVSIVVQGGNTGLTGGGVPFGGIVMSLKNLNRIRAVDPVNATLVAEAGVVLTRAQEAAADVGMLFPLSLGSEGSCTIGGNISTNAGGTAVLRYGNMRDLVLGVEVVLPDGRVLDAMSALRKDNTGYDLKHLFIGSEGTLGIVTAAVLKLFPAPRSRATAMVGASSPKEIVDLFTRLRAATGDMLSTFEILPRFALDIVLKHGRQVRDPFSTPYPSYALIELTSPELDSDLATRLESVLGESLEANEILDATIAASGAQASDLWRLRELTAELQHCEGASIKHDVSVPISRVADFLIETTALCEKDLPGIRVCAFGHIGDGNIHFNLSQPIGMDAKKFLAKWHHFNDIVHGEVSVRGGSISAEHGIGLIKRDELPRYKDPVALDLMTVIKRAIDPANLLNPGKVVRIGNDLPAFRPGHR